MREATLTLVMAVGLLAMSTFSAVAQQKSDAVEAGGQAVLLNGMFLYFADSARLAECESGRDLPVAMEGDYLRLERAYMEMRPAPAAPLLVTIEAGIEQRPPMEGEGTRATVIVKRFVNVWPGESCERNRVAASLVNTYWRIVRLGDDEVHVVDGRREPHMVLRSGDPGRFSATVGCNQMLGGYEVQDETLRFSAAASTMMACPPPLDGYELALGRTLEETRTWRIAGQFLELADSAGKPVALFRAVYLP